MWFNFFVAVLIIIVPAVWSTKAKGFGAFSALLAAVSTLAAGGIAFAFWEPLAYMILGWSSGMSGFAGDLLQGSAFSLGLIVPFLASLLIFRLALDSFVRANLDLGDTANIIGGGLFGLIVSIVAGGIFTISVGYLRLPSSIMGYSPIEEKNGQVVYSSKLWIPADLLVTRLYERLSVAAFGSSTPLLAMHPNVHEAAGMQRLTYADASKNTITGADFELLGSYSIAGAADELSKDSFIVDPSGQAKKQTIFYPDNTSPSGAATLTGYTVRFKSGAKEKGGNVVVTPAQVRLICHNDETGDSFAIHPIAVVAPPEATAAGLYRFRFDAPESFIASQGGGADTTFAFEFMLPQGYVGRSMLIKNYRVDVSEDSPAGSPRMFPNYQSRDKAIRDGVLFAGGSAASPASASAINKSGSTRLDKVNNRFESVEESEDLPGGVLFSRNVKGGLELNEQNEVVQGENTFKRDQLNERGIDKNLRVERFAISKDTGVIKVTLSESGTRTTIGRGVEASDNSLQPVLVDERGTRYEPIGYQYAEGDEVTLKYYPGRPIRSLADMPALSRSKRDQTLILIFRPTKKIKISAFVVGNNEIASFSGGLEVR